MIVSLIRQILSTVSLCFLTGETHYQLVLLCCVSTFAKMPPASVFVSDRGSVIFFWGNLCGMLTKRRGLPQYTQLYVTS